jgi:hypothetical protein
MSGTYSDLLNAQHASNALSAIANPGQVNVLGAYNAATQTGANMLNLQKLLAEKAVGRAAQGAINPDTGEYDPNAFGKNLVAAGPQAAFGAQQGLLNNQSLSDAQLNQARVKLQFVQSRAGALLDKPTITPQDVLGVFQQGLASGVMTMPEVARQMQIVQGLDAAGLRTWAQQHQLSALQTESQINQQYGTGGTQTGPGGVTVGTVQAPPRKGGGVSMPPQQGAPQGVPPGPGGMLTATVMTPNGPQQIQVPYEQVYPQGAKPPTPPAPGTTIPGAYQPRQGAGAPPPATQPPAATAAPPAATSAPVVQTPAGPAITTSAPAGTTQDIEAYKQAQAQMPDQQRNLVSGEAAMEALKLARSGPGTDTVNRIKSFLLAQGIDLGAIDPSKPEAYQLARKNLLRFAQSSGAKVGTDLGLATQLESNANVDTMLNSANEHVLKQDMGVARQRVAQTLEAPQGGAGMGAHTQTFTNNTDPRGFAWDLYTPDERNKIVAEASKTKGGLDKLDKAIEIAAKHGLIRVPKNAQQ